MARETKQDRIVRGIVDQVTEHLHELKTIEANLSAKESDVERWAQSFIKNCLGFTASAGYSVRAQEQKGKMRPDLVVFHEDRPVFVVEVKKTGFDLGKSDFRSGKIQLSEYLHSLGNVRFGMLTNGSEWKLFDFSQVQYGGIEASCLDLRGEDDSFDLGKKAIEEQCYDLLDFHESGFSTDVWSELAKEALAFSPESLARAILSVDVVKNIARHVRGEHEFRANHEVLTDRVYWLLEQGLNDAIIGWNEAKATEMHKYVKSQKRSSRRTKRNVKKATEGIAAVNSAVEAVETTAETSDSASNGAA